MILADVETWLHGGGIGLATFVSEDLTCVATGLLIHARQLHWFVGLAACTLGILAGDAGLWLMGRTLGRAALRIRWVASRLPAERVDQLGVWFDRRGWSAVLAARFLPGTRFPVYVAAGILGRRVDRFLLWALLAALLWTPLLVLSAALLGPVVEAPLRRLLGANWLAFALAILLIVVAFRGMMEFSSTYRRAALVARLSRLWRWEFWPAWLFYLPLGPWLAWLALRHYSLRAPLAANPGISHGGGVVGESKSEILAHLPAEWIVPTALLSADDLERRLQQLTELMRARDWQFPLILKPDVGQRGAGVRLVRDTDDARRCLAEIPETLIAQRYHPGPYEAGIFYYRFPDDARGRIFSITDKLFPLVVGDGMSSIEALIWRDGRLRMQARVFLARLGAHGAARVPAAGERVPLAIAGNHCQGTLFRDGSHLITPQLEARIDAIACGFSGFYFGRFDVRYSDVDEFRAGRDLAIVELNGSTSESTNIYDPTWSLWRAYRVLMRQWAVLFAIGAQNLKRGVAAPTPWRMLGEIRAHYRARHVSALAD